MPPSAFKQPNWIVDNSRASGIVGRNCQQLRGGALKDSPFLHVKLAGDAKKSGPQAEERVVKTVVDAVLAHRLLPGERLIERELAEAAGAGRMAIRNGLLRLANANLVEISRNRGATVIQATPEESRQIFEARIVIEEAALRKLGRTIDADGLNQLDDIARTEAEAYAAGDIEQARHLARSFHVAVAKLADNAPMARFVEDLINCQPLLQANRAGERSTFSGGPTHQRIVEALRNGDGDRAAWLNTGLLTELESELNLDQATADDDAGANGPDNDTNPTKPAETAKT